MALRRPTDPHRANGVGSSFTASGCRNCMTCGKWRSQAGGRIHPRTRMWQCHGCTPVPAKPEVLPCAK